MDKNNPSQSNNGELLEAIDRLAQMTKNGFDRAEENLEEFKGEFKDFKKETVHTVSNIDVKLYGIDGQLKEVQKALEPLLIGYSILHKEVEAMSRRIVRLEKKTGIVD